MRSTRTFLLGGLAGLAVLALTSLLVAQDTDRSKAAVLRVSLPADAQLEIEGVKTKATGSVRMFQSPALEPNKNYTYTLKATWTENGKPVTVSRVVKVQAGKEFPVDLRSADKAGGGSASPAKKPIDDSAVKTTKGKPKLTVPYVPTPQEVVDEMLKMAKVTDKDTVYDLGCGDGRIIVTAAKKYGAKAFGVDLDPERVKDTQQNIKKNDVGNLVTVKEGDVLKTDVSAATVVTLYLLPEVNEKLKPILKKQLKPGSRIVSHDFDMGDWKPVDQKELTDKNGQAHTIYLWKIEAGDTQAPTRRTKALALADDKEKEPDVIYVPTPQAVVDRMLELVEVKKQDLVYDLGCGDGRIVVTAAKKYGCKAIGYDIDPKRIKESNENVEKNKVGKLVTIEKKDIFTLDLSKAQVITLYLLPELNVKLIPQLEKLKDGSRIVSHDFDMRGVKPKKVEKITAKDDNGNEREHTIYLWITPLEKEKE